MTYGTISNILLTTATFLCAIDIYMGTANYTTYGFAMINLGGLAINAYLKKIQDERK